MFALGYNGRLKNLPPALKRKPVYENYQKNLEQMKELFKDSVNPDRFSELPLFDVEPLKTPVPENVYDGFKICGLNVTEVGCGVICTLQAISSYYERSDTETICTEMENKGYYYPGRGLWWHWFDNLGCQRITHWYNICMALYESRIVTVLVKYPERERSLFLNILGMKNLREGDYIEDAKQLVFLTNEGELTLEELAKYMTTVPYVW